MIDEQDISRLKEIFITRQECESNLHTIEQQVNSENVRLAVIEHQLKNITWLIMTVGAGVIGILIKIFFGG